MFSAVSHDPPTEEDFEPYAVLGLRPKPSPSYRTAQWFGVSMFDDPATVERFVEARERRGERFYSARVRLKAGLGLDVIYNGRTGHLDVFGFPEVLLACCASTA